MREIKIRAKDLNFKSTEKLLEMKRELKLHIARGKIKARPTQGKGFNLKQEKRNIARINTILSERENSKKIKEFKKVGEDNFGSKGTIKK